MQKKQFITTVAIDDDLPPCDDKNFITTRGLKPTNLLRSKIKELREREEGAPTLDGLQNAISALQKRMSNLTDFLEEKGLIEEFLKQQNI